MFAEVIPLHSSLSDRGFSYRVPDGLSQGVRPGILVGIPLRDELAEGIVVRLHDALDPDEPLDAVRDVAAVLCEHSVVSEAQLATVRAISHRHYVPAHRVLGVCFPAPVAARARRRPEAFAAPVAPRDRAFFETLHFFPDSRSLAARIRETLSPGTVVVWPDDRALFEAVSASDVPSSWAVVPTPQYGTRRATLYADARIRRAEVLLTTRRGVFLPIESYDRVVYVEESLVSRYTAFRHEYRYADWLSAYARHSGLYVEWHAVAPPVSRMYDAVMSGSLVTHS